MFWCPGVHAVQISGLPIDFTPHHSDGVLWRTRAALGFGGHDIDGSTVVGLIGDYTLDPLMENNWTLSIGAAYVRLDEQDDTAGLAATVRRSIELHNLVSVALLAGIGATGPYTTAADGIRLAIPAGAAVGFFIPVPRDLGGELDLWISGRAQIVRHSTGDTDYLPSLAIGANLVFPFMIGLHVAFERLGWGTYRESSFAFGLHITG